MLRIVCVLALISVLGGCKPTPPAPEPGPHERTESGVHFVEVLTNGADDAAPVVVWLHGRGEDPERYVAMWSEYGGKARVEMPQAPSAADDGFSWYDWPSGASDDELTALVAAAEDKLWTAIAAVAHGRKLVVAGFSQGAVLSYIIAARHPDAVVHAFPMSGGAPKKLLPAEGAKTAPVDAWHGTADGVIAIDYARATVAGFKAAGAPIDFHEVDGVGHTITPAMRADLFAHIRAALP